MDDDLMLDQPLDPAAETAPEESGWFELSGPALQYLAQHEAVACG